MRNISLSLAALTLVLAGSLTSVAFADTERQHTTQRADREIGGESATTLQSQVSTPSVGKLGPAKGSENVSDARGGAYDSAYQFRDATGHPLGGWQSVIYGTVNY